jgi:hypothetical protein
METESSLSCSQEPTISPYSEPNESSSRLPKLILSDRN